MTQEATDAEVVEEARDLLKSNERKEAMEAALDITATTTKQQAKAAVKKAEKDFKKATEKYTKDHSNWRDLRDELAFEILCGAEMTEKLMQIVKALSGVEVDPEEVWHRYDVYQRTEAYGGGLVVVGQPVIEFDFERSDDNVTTRISSGNGHTVSLDLSDHVELSALQLKMDASSKEKDSAEAIMDDARERLANHEDLVDAARVQLQRHKLASMGEAGTAVVERVDQLLETQKEGDYLALL